MKGTIAIFTKKKMAIFKKHFKAFQFISLSTLIFSLLIITPNYRHYPVAELKDLLYIIAHWGLSACGIFAIFSLISLNKYLYAVTLPLFSIIAVTTAYFVWQIDISLNSALIESILLTNRGEAFSYVDNSLVFLLIGATLLSLFFIIWRFKSIWKQQHLYPLLIAAIIATTLFIATNHTRYNTLTARAPFAFYSAFMDYYKDRQEAHSERIMLGEGSRLKTDSIITVFIIGEALRADHIQMNGYHRTTMPQMEKRGVISLPNIHTPFTHTAASLPYILSRADMEHQERMYAESSFIDIFTHSGFHTSWLANQNPITPFRFFIHESHSVFINKPQLSDYSNTAKYDSDLIEPFINTISQPHPNQLIITHMAGNHWWYNNNLPKEFIHFKPILENKTLSLNNRERMINTYDNVTLSTDHILNELMKGLENKKALLIFLADHGQSFGENGKWLHANDTPPEQNPACFFWFSDTYKAEHPEKVAALIANKDRNIDTAFLFHTIIAGSQISSPHLNNAYNLFYRTD
ncbi:sulfatase-like hydrolase/transferase [Geofilum rubicundum]|uniref:Uncharacterized protein n=1 Tax=Geofilum rubicundum JCM 15548 TaxID=1236989 RepID=A0A0E9LVN6_9BACT|nr:phosphoethanolamine transferase [Geofilum rubicundum]GAO29191.1 hypothetical protein JCM15548_11356 [Geofilum rubicundum JCM 15548]